MAERTIEPRAEAELEEAGGEQASDTLFMHFPLLSLPDPLVSLLGGTLRQIPFRLFEKLDQDWAREDRFTEARPVFWCASIPRPIKPPSVVEHEDKLAALMKNSRPGVASPAEQAQLSELITKAYFWPDDPLRARGIRRRHRQGSLIHLALLAATDGQPFPDPLLSMRYAQRGDGVTRKVGMYHRTYLLQAASKAPIQPREMALVVRYASHWQQLRLRPRDAYFAPLRAITASAYMEESLQILPLAVCLEGCILPDNVRGIARELKRRLHKLLGSNAPADLDSRVTALYDWRSDVLHGRPFARSDGPALVDWARALSVQVVLSTIAQAVSLKSNLQGVQAWLRTP